MTARPVRRVGPGEFVPLVVFAAVYVPTCVIGAFLLIIDYRPFVALWEYFSGTTAPHLTNAQLVTSVELLVLPPLALVLGYALVQRAKIPNVSARPPGVLPSATRLRGLPHVVFCALTLIGATSLLRAGSFTRLDSWLSYEAWIDARWTGFASMSFFEFVNIYTFVPLAAAWCALATREPGIRAAVVRWTPTVLAILLTLALFQKKAALVAFVIVLSAILVEMSRDRPTLLRRRVALGVLALAVGYFAMVVLPTFNIAVNSEPALQRTRAALLTPNPSAQPQPTATSVTTTVPTTRSTTVPTTVPTHDASGLVTTVPSVAATTVPTTAPTTVPAARQAEAVTQAPDPLLSIVAYSLFAPLMRTSAPALYYSVVFPEAHPFYGPDVGLDIVCSKRIGCSGLRMPDDNLVVWDYMNPTLGGGSVTAPFQFALYSQAGLLGAVFGGLLLGAILAAGWRVAQSYSWPPLISDLLSAVVILLAINLALDSPRNSIIVSYGAFWGVAFVLVAAFLLRAVKPLQSTRLPDLGPKGI